MRHFVKGCYFGVWIEKPMDSSKAKNKQTKNICCKPLSRLIGCIIVTRGVTTKHCTANFPSRSLNLITRKQIQWCIELIYHDDVIKWKHFPRYWPFVRGIPAQRPVTRNFDVFFDLSLNKRLSKQSWGWWSETPSSSLWRHSNVLHDLCCCGFKHVLLHI